MSKENIAQQVEDALGQKLENILPEMKRNGKSSTQMYKEITGKTKINFSKRTLQRWLRSFGIEYSKNEAGRQRWKDGLMNEALKKSRHSLIESKIKGSKIEEQIRWVLKNEFEKISGYEFIIGFTNWTILDNLEIDIPIVCFRKVDQETTKIAIEVDGSYFHKNETKWEEKYRKLREKGWHPIRIFLNQEISNKKAYQIYLKNNVRALVDFDKLITNIKNILNIH